MYNIVTVVRDIKGEKKEQKMLYGTGRLTNDPPAVRTVGDMGLRKLQGNKDHRFSIAFKQGPKKDDLFYPLTAWAEQADNLAKLGFKGQTVEIAARVEEQNYTDRDGNPQSIEILVVERFDVKEYKNNKKGNGNSTAGSNQSSNGAETGENTGALGKDPFPEDGKPIVVEDDDIPF